MRFNKKTKQKRLKEKNLLYLRFLIFLYILILSHNTVLSQLDDSETFEFIPKAENYEYSEFLKEPYLVVYSNLSISVFDYNDYYIDLYYTGAINKEPDNILYIYDENNNLLKDYPYYENEINVIPFNQDYKKFQLNNQIKEVVFCNYNNICENNQDNLLENNLICKDCEKSTKDNYCDLDIDNICDLDCLDYDYDCDCIYCEKFQEHLPDAIPETCEVFSGKICNLNETCTGSFINVTDSERCCIKGDCIIKETSKKINNNNLLLIFISAFILILFIILLILFIKKKKIITISLISIILFLVVSLNVIAEQTLTREQMINKICEITKLYREKKGISISGSFVLGFAQTETGLRHWDSNGNVIVTGDGGVGIMQITGNINVRGNSIKDGHKLNVYNFEDNVEAGILEILSKCNSLNCLNPNSKKEYYCQNYRGLPEKRIIYSGWNLAIRAYNGWGCNAPIFRDQWIQKSNGNVNIFRDCFDKGGSMDFCLEKSGVDFNIFNNGFDESNPYDGYTPIAKRIQNYVDLVNQNANLFKNACSNDILINEKPPVEDFPKQDKKDINNFIINKNGYYYLSSLIKTSFSFNLSKIDNELIFINKLIEETHKCMFDIKYNCSLENNFVCLDENDDEQECQSDNQILTCKNTLKTYQQCARRTLERFNKDNWYIDYCPSDEEEKECYQKGKIWDNKCINKPNDYDTNSIIKFCIQTGETLPYYDEKNKKYYQKPLNIKFALDTNGNKIKLDSFEYDDIKEIESKNNENLPNTIKPISISIQQTNLPTYYKLYEQIKTKMGGTLPLYTDCTEDIDAWAWCWVHSGCHGYGIYCKQDKLEKASQSYLSQLFTHEITHNLQAGRCSNSIESEWGAEYYSGSNYYCFKVGNNWLKASQVAQLMKQKGCSQEQLIETAFCRNKCPNPASDVVPVRGGNCYISDITPE